MRRIWLLTILISTLGHFGYSQDLMSGMVADSTTFRSLPNVNIQVRNKTYGTVTDARGFFRIQVAITDTLIFTMLGYRSRIVPVTVAQNSPVIYLREEARILKTIEINADILIPGLDQMEVMKAWENPANTYAKTPGFQGIETFGPGHAFRLGELQHNREEKKLKEIKAINQKSSHYVETVNSPEVKDKLMQEFNLTEKAFFDLLAKFNQKNRDFIYELSKQELTSLLFIFFSENVNKK